MTQADQPKQYVLPTALVALLLGMALTLATSGYQFGQSNHLVYLPDPIHKVDPTLLANDWFTTQTLQYHSVFGLLTRMLFRAGVLEWGFLIGYLLTVLSLHLFWQRLVFALGGSISAYLLSVVMIQILGGGTALGGYHILQDAAFLPSNIAAVAMLGGLVALCYVQQKPHFWVYASMGFGVAAALHLNFSVVVCILWPVVSAVGYLQYKAGGRSHRAMQDASILPTAQLRSWLIASGILGVFVCMNVLPALGRLTSPPAMPFSQFIEIYARLRHPHHYDPLSWHWAMWLIFLVPLLAGVWVIISQARSARPACKTQACLLAAYFTFVSLVLIAFLFAGVWFVSERLIQLSLFRFSIFVQLISCCFVAIAASHALAHLKWVRVTFICLPALIVASSWLVPIIFADSPAASFCLSHAGALHLIAIFIWLGVPVIFPQQRPWPALVTKAIPMLAFGLVVLPWFVMGGSIVSSGKWLGFDLSPDDNTNYISLTQWIADDANTPRDAIILVPPHEQSMRVYGKRAIVVNYKGVPQLSIELAQWQTRMEAVLGVPLETLPRPMPETLKAMEQIYANRSAKDLLAVAKAYNATFIITLAPQPELGNPMFSPAPIPANASADDIAFHKSFPSYYLYAVNSNKIPPQSP